MRNLDDFSNRDYTSVNVDYWRALRRLYHWFRQRLMSKKNRIFFGHMIYNLTVSTTRKDCIGLTFFTGIGSLVFKASNLRVSTPSNFASYVMDVSIEWRPLFEEIGFAVLDSSGVDSHWIVFFARSSYIFHHSCSSAFKNLP